MEPADGASTQLATFDPPLADAVVTVLRREGIPARSEPVDHDQVEITVPADRREQALTLLAGRMEAVHELVAGSGEVKTVESDGHMPPAGKQHPADHEGLHEDAGEASERPLLMERLRGVGYGLAALLVPLLVITVAGRNLPAGYALVVFVAGLVAITWWRGRRRDGESTEE